MIPKSGSRLSDAITFERDAEARPWAVQADGLRLTVRVTPKGGRDAVDGIEQRSDGQCVLRVRVRAAPSDGAANTAATALIARTLDVAPRDVTLAAGASSRIKRFTVAGDGPSLAAALERLAAKP